MRPISIRTLTPAAILASTMISFAPALPAQTAPAACANAVSTVDIQNCQQNALKTANAALNAAYQRRMAGLSSSRRATLRSDERAWIAQRDRTCAVKPDSGTSGSLDTAQCLLRETEARTRVLSGAS